MKADQVWRWLFAEPRNSCVLHDTQHPKFSPWWKLQTHHLLNSEYNIQFFCDQAGAIKIHSGATSYCSTPQQATQKLQPTWWEISALIKTLGPQLASMNVSMIKSACCTQQMPSFLYRTSLSPKLTALSSLPMGNKWLCLSQFNTDFTLCGDGWLLTAHLMLCFGLSADRTGLTQEEENTCPANQTLSHFSVYPRCASVSSWQDLKGSPADAPKHN